MALSLLLQAAGAASSSNNQHGGIMGFKLNGSWAGRFFVIWTGQALSMFGSSLVQFALVWWLTSSTGSATVLSVATLIALLPQILIGPLAGPLVDRLDRRRIMIISDLGVAAATAVLMLLFLYGRVQLWHIYIAMAARSFGQAFHSPAMISSTSLLVPAEHHTRISGLNQTLHGLMNIIAPPVGAILISTLPMQGVLAIDLITAMLAVSPLFFISIPSPSAAHKGEAGKGSPLSSYAADLKAGLAYVFGWKGLFALILLAMLLNFLLAPAGSLMPILVTKVFGKGAIELAAVETAIGAGVIAGGLALSAWGGFRKKILTSLIGVAGIGFGVLIVGISPASFFMLTIAASFVTGVTQVLANGSLSAILMSSVRRDMQGRVFSLLSAGAAAMMPLSLMIAGPLSDRFGIRTWYIGGGIICIAVSLLSMGLKPLMEIESNSSDVSPQNTSAAARQD